MQAEPHAALSWAWWVEWFHFAQRKSRAWEGRVACPRCWGLDLLLIPHLVLCPLPPLLPRSTVKYLQYPWEGLGCALGFCSILVPGLVGMAGQHDVRASWRQGSTPLALALLSCRWALPSWPGSAVFSRPQLTDGEVENFLILQ